jgi:hypothetical protein
MAPAGSAGRRRRGSPRSRNSAPGRPLPSGGRRAGHGGADLARASRPAPAEPRRGGRSRRSAGNRRTVRRRRPRRGRRPCRGGAPDGPPRRRAGGRSGRKARRSTPAVRTGARGGRAPGPGPHGAACRNASATRRAWSRSSLDASSKPMVKLRNSARCGRASATSRLESMPPLRKQPTGTSETSCERTASASPSPRRLSASAGSSRSGRSSIRQ